MNISYGRQFIDDDDIQAVVKALRSDYLTQGPAIADFEAEFARYVGCEYAVAVANGTAALHIAALALGAGPGLKVITTPLTFAASANCVLYCGGEVVFVDIEPDSFLIDLDKLENLLEQHPTNTFNGVIPVDFAGYPVDMTRLSEIARKHRLWILEDACHAPGGGFFNGNGLFHRCGSCDQVDAAIFSFHPVKHIATGEGGMITTNRKDLYERLLLLRTHGITKNPALLQQSDGGWYYEMQILGYNYRLSDIHAALGSSQLKKAENNMTRRQEIALRYDEAFAACSQISPPKVKDGFYHAYHLYVVLVENRKQLYDHLVSHCIFPQIHYIPVHLQPFYRKFGWKQGDFPVVENYYQRCLSLPMYPSLKADEQAFVIEKVLEFYD